MLPHFTQAATSWKTHVSLLTLATSVWVLYHARTEGSDVVTHGSSLTQARGWTHVFGMQQHSVPHSVASDCSRNLRHQRELLYTTYQELFQDIRYVALIGFPKHENKGDSWIYLAQETILASLGITIVHVYETMADYSKAHLDDLARQYPRFAIALHGGGNVGDMYWKEINIRQAVLEDFPDERIVWFPQSIHYRKTANANKLADALSRTSDTHVVLRDKASFDFAQAHFAFPNVSLHLSPDIVFAMGERHDLRSRFPPTTDLLVFKRVDGEGTAWDWLHSSLDEFLGDASEAAATPFTYTIGDWMEVKRRPDEVGRPDFSHSFVAWHKSMVGAEWLSSGRLVVTDRLHGHIVSLLLGIPHLLVDNKIGKLSDYYETWTKECRLGRIVNSTSATELQTEIKNGLVFAATLE